MRSKRLISASLSEESKTKILYHLAEIKKELDFLLTLQPDDIKHLYKAGNGYIPFIEKAHNTVISHPDIMPNVFNIDEFNKDYELAKDLTPIINSIKELDEGLQVTYTAVYSDTLSGSLDVYAAVKQNRDKVPGLNVAADEMAEFFKRPRKKSEPSEPAS